MSEGDSLTPKHVTVVDGAVVHGDKPLDEQTEAALGHLIAAARQQLGAAERQTEEIRLLLESPFTSFWFKDAMQAALKRDPVDAINDAERLASLLRQRSAALLGNRHQGEVTTALETFLEVFWRHQRDGGAHPLDAKARSADPDAMAVFDFLLTMMQEARHYHPDGHVQGSDFLLAWNYVLLTWAGETPDSLRDCIRQMDSAARFGASVDLFKLLDDAYRELHGTPLLPPCKHGVSDLAFGLHSWTGHGQDRIQVVGVELGSWNWRPSRRVLPSVSFLTTERSACLISELVAGAETVLAWSCTGAFMPSSTWLPEAAEGWSPHVPVWTIKPAKAPGWIAKTSLAGPLESDLKVLTGQFGRMG